MVRFCFLVFFIAAVGLSHGTIVELCGGASIVNGVEVEGCLDGVNGRCVFIKGRTYLVSVDATLQSLATSLPYTAKAVILGIPITLFQGEGCEFLTTGVCPVQSGQRIVFANGFEITSQYPALQSTLTVEVLDQNKVLQGCASFKFTLVNA